jgi:hypothetical protein
MRQTALFLNTFIDWRENLLLWISRPIFERLKHIFVIFQTLSLNLLNKIHLYFLHPFQLTGHNHLFSSFLTVLWFNTM